MRKPIIFLAGFVSLVLPLLFFRPACAETAAERLDDYLYRLSLDHYIRETEQPMQAAGISGGCTSIRNGSLYGRNLDLNYSSVPEFVIHLSGDRQRLESIGVCANPYITDNVDDMTEDDLLRMPNITNDGINEKGVIASVNVVLAGDLDDRSGTAPGREKLWAPYVVRYLLDHAESAEHAVKLLHEVDIVGGFEGYSLHWMIADRKDTFIAEILHGRLVISRNEYTAMTNFYMTLGPAVPQQTAAGRVFTGLPRLNDFAIGVERYACVRDHYEQSATMEGMLSLLQSVKATAMYHRPADDRWYTEFTDETLPITVSAKAFEEAYRHQLDAYEHRDRTDPKGDWITWHTAIYDLENRSLSLYSQEEYGRKYEFRLN